jgi:hypothetical protein
VLLVAVFAYALVNPVMKRNWDAMTDAQDDTLTP